jgi:GLPGLI family protein
MKKLTAFHVTILILSNLQAQFTTNKAIEPAHYVARYNFIVKQLNSIQASSYLLLIGENFTLFVDEKRQYIDSVKFTTSDILMNIGLSSEYRNADKQKILINRQSNLAFVYDTPIIDPMYFEQILAYQWEIENETIRKAGISCQKATTKFGGRLYTAWFAPIIPMSVGPYKFQGLPGLIVSIEDSEGKYKIELTQFTQAKTDNPIHLYYKKTPRKCTQLEMRNIFVSLHTNPEMVIRSIPGVTVSENFYENLKTKPIPEFLEILEE